MRERWFITDTHFAHNKIIVFENDKGERIRPFDSVEEHDEHIVEKWNSVVKEHHTVYHLGDVAIARRGLKVLERLNGRKILVKGNHDLFKLKDYTEYFKDIRSYLVNPGLPGEGKLFFSHVPVHIATLGRFGFNVHGHVHYNSLPDTKNYLNICPERAGYTPLHFDQILEHVNKMKENDDGHL